MILDKLRRKKKPETPPLRRSEFLSLKPMRSPLVEWEKNEKGEVTITLPLKKLRESEKLKRKTSKSTRILSTLFPGPEEKQIQLDKIGSIVWELCDGKRTTKKIVDYLCQKYKLLPREAEVSLSSYLNSLAKRGLIGYIVPEHLRERFAKKEEAEESQRSDT